MADDEKMLFGGQYLRTSAEFLSILIYEGILFGIHVAWNLTKLFNPFALFGLLDFPYTRTQQTLITALGISLRFHIEIDWFRDKIESIKNKSAAISNILVAGSWLLLYFSFYTLFQQFYDRFHIVNSFVQETDYTVLNCIQMYFSSFFNVTAATTQYQLEEYTNTAKFVLSLFYIMYFIERMSVPGSLPTLYFGEMAAWPFIKDLMFQAVTNVVCAVMILSLAILTNFIIQFVFNSTKLIEAIILAGSFAAATVCHLYEVDRRKESPDSRQKLTALVTANKLFLIASCVVLINCFYRADEYVFEEAATKVRLMEFSPGVVTIDKKWPCHFLFTIYQAAVGFVAFMAAKVWNTRNFSPEIRAYD